MRLRSQRRWQISQTLSKSKCLSALKGPELRGLLTAPTSLDFNCRNKKSNKRRGWISASAASIQFQLSLVPIKKQLVSRIPRRFSPSYNHHHSLTSKGSTCCFCAWMRRLHSPIFFSRPFSRRTTVWSIHFRLTLGVLIAHRWHVSKQLQAIASMHRSSTY